MGGACQLKTDRLLCNDEREFRTFGALFAAVGQGTLLDPEFDNALWLLTADRVYRAEDLKELPGPVLRYFASRLIEVEVGTGGFAEAVVNALEWFGVAAAGYEALGCSQAAVRIRQVAAVTEAGGLESDGFAEQLDSAVENGGMCAETVFEQYDQGLEDIGWWATERRLAYVLRHQQAFVSLDPRTRH